MESALDHHTARALLEWQIELGADEAIADASIDRYEIAAVRPDAKPAGIQFVPTKAKSVDPIDEARALAGATGDLAALRAAMAAFEHCELKRGARNLVFSDGNPAARVMVIGEAPGREDDIEGRPFTAQAGQLLDRMLGAIGLSRAAKDAATSAYLTCAMPWRPPRDRDPSDDEIAMMQPFLARHVELAAPDILILIGNVGCQAGLGKRGITRLRGDWHQAFGRPAMAIASPAYLLRNPAAKRDAWADLLAVQARLRETH